MHNSRNLTPKLLGMLLSAVAMPLYAQSAPAAQQAELKPQNANQIDEIVVTAQKREENVQSVPIAITALSSQELANRSVTQIADLQSATPNVTFSTTAQGTFASTVGVRGIRNSNIELVNDQPAAIYIDGVYQSTAIGSMALLGPDVERIEVLRGPQGTLFGRNTVAGAVSITTRRPSNELEASVMAGLGNHGAMDGQAMLNIPLVRDTVSARFNIGYHNDNGYATEQTFGARLGQSTSFYARGQLLAKVGDSFRILIEGDYLRASTEGNLLQNIYLTSPSFRAALTGNASYSLAYTSIAIARGLAPIPANYQTVVDYIATCAGGATPNLSPRCFGADRPGGTVTTTGFFKGAQVQNPAAYYREYGGAVTATLDLTPEIELKSITSYRDFMHDSPKDYDGTPVVVLFARASPSGKTFTQEGQLNGTLLDKKLKFALGAFYYHFDGVEVSTNAALENLTGPNAAGYLENNLTNKSLGIYGQGTYSVTESFRVTAGGRYTSEDKAVAITQYGSRSAPTLQACTLPLPNAQCVNTADLHYTAWDYTFGADYDLSDHVLTYVRVAKGFQAGGINQRSTSGVPFQTYQPQTAINYELGLKADLFDRRARFNVAVFQSDVKGFQRAVPQSYLVNGLPVTVVATINAADARIRGAEAELTFIPFENARIATQVGYLDTKWKTFLANGPLGPNTLDLSHTAFQQISDWTFGISPSYTLPTSFGEVHFQADYYWQSEQNLAPLLSYPLENELPVPGVIQKGYGLLNARIALRVGQGTEIAIWGKNLTDKRFFTGALNLANTLGFANATVGNPRTFGIQARHNF